MLQLITTFVQALPPKDIKFAPLNKPQQYTGEEMMTLYEASRLLKLRLT